MSRNKTDKTEKEITSKEIKAKEAAELTNDVYYSRAKNLLRTEKSLAFNSLKEIIEFMHKWDEIRNMYSI